MSSMYELSAQRLFVFTGDEAEQSAGHMLGRFQRCGPHRLSTSVKRTFQALSLMKHGGVTENRLLESTKLIVQFLVRRYRARQESDKICEEENTLRVAEGKALIGAFCEFSNTRFLGALFLGQSYVANIPVTEKMNSHALMESDTDPYNKWPQYKERFGLEWQDITYVSQDVNKALVRLSGELYPTISQLFVAIKTLETRLWKLVPIPCAPCAPEW
jgi:hypothetical protein